MYLIKKTQKKSIQNSNDCKLKKNKPQTPQNKYKLLEFRNLKIEILQEYFRNFLANKL